ncbi:MAG: hypothetical protein AAGA85_25860 [Bacteroidota bacterium]
MDKRTEFDDFFKDQFDTYQGEVDEGAWKNLLSSLQNINSSTSYKVINKAIILMLFGSIVLLPRDGNPKRSLPGGDSYALVHGSDQQPVASQRVSHLALSGDPGESDMEKGIKSYEAAQNRKGLAEEIEPETEESGEIGDKVAKTVTFEKLDDSYPKLTKKRETLALSKEWNFELSWPDAFPNEGTHVVKHKKVKRWRPFLQVGILSNYQTPKAERGDMVLVTFPEADTWQPRITSWTVDLGLRYRMTRRVEWWLGASFQRVDQTISHENHHFLHYEIGEIQENSFLLHPTFDVVQETTSFKVNEMGLMTGLGYKLFNRPRSPQLNLLWNTYLTSIHSSITNGENVFRESESIKNQLTIGLEIPMVHHFSIRPQLVLGMGLRDFQGPFDLANRSMGIAIIWIR